MHGRSSASPIYFVGTAPALWQPLAATLWRQWTSTASREGGVLADPLVDLRELAAEQPSARFVLCIDSPADSLLASWAGAAVRSPCIEDVLARWSGRAQQLLALVHRHRERCLCIATTDIGGTPAALAAALLAWDPALAQLPPALPPTPAFDPVRRVLAEAAAQSSPMALGQYAELSATCVELRSAAPSDPVFDGALQALASLEAARAAGQVAAERVIALEKDLERERSQARPDPNLVRELAESRDENRRQMLEWHNALQELERLDLLRRKLQAELDAARRPPDPDIAVERALAEAREDRELLLLQSHHLQEELEHHYICLNEQQDPPKSQAGYGVRTRRARMGHAVAHPPHRHLDVELERVETDHARLDALTVRLVEHAGRPGLLLFGADGRPGPLAAWAPNGREGERPFMLLVPGDDEGRKLLDRMGTRDWRLVCGLVQQLRNHLARAGSAQTNWLVIAARLGEALAALPPRWRYDTLTCQADPATAGAFRVGFGEASFGDRLLGDARFRWQPALRRLVWAAPEDPRVVPVAAWPAQQDGLLEPEWVVPVGSDHDAPDRRQRMAALGGVEQRMLLGLLDALPSTADRLLPGDAIDPAVLRDHALALRRDAQQTWLRVRIGQWLRRALRRTRP